MRMVGTSRAARVPLGPTARLRLFPDGGSMARTTPVHQDGQCVECRTEQEGDR
ncbi:hypothetical protein [Streptomyces longispororuber]|uniref:hypothetical protein n=1 Tax=Streptomyces longispororuber TaxID=68230 RepID=UPI00167DD2FE|nr:hypothetical protein [Streptomyces longispororuber]